MTDVVCHWWLKMIKDDPHKQGQNAQDLQKFVQQQTMPEP